MAVLCVRRPYRRVRRSGSRRSVAPTDRAERTWTVADLGAQRARPPNPEFGSEGRLPQDRARPTGPSARFPAEPACRSGGDLGPDLDVPADGRGDAALPRHADVSLLVVGAEPEGEGTVLLWHRETRLHEAAAPTHRCSPLPAQVTRLARAGGRATADWSRLAPEFELPSDRQTTPRASLRAGGADQEKTVRPQVATEPSNLLFMLFPA